MPPPCLLHPLPVFVRVLVGGIVLDRLNRLNDPLASSLLLREMLTDDDSDGVVEFEFESDCESDGVGVIDADDEFDCVAETVGASVSVGHDRVGLIDALREGRGENVRQAVPVKFQNDSVSLESLLIVGIDLEGDNDPDAP